MFELKRIAESAIDAALEKAERYRLLNEPLDAESICRDVLAVDPDNQRALVNLILALSDQFEHAASRCLPQAQEVIPRLQGEYERAYYTGIICERRAKATLRRAGPGSGAFAYEWLTRAMTSYEQAETHRPPGNDDATLRWNTCARIIRDNPAIKREEHVSAPVELE